MTAKTTGNLCTCCGRRYTTDDMYWTCDPCVESKYANPRTLEIATFKLPGNP